MVKSCRQLNSEHFLSVCSKVIPPISRNISPTLQKSKSKPTNRKRGRHDRHEREENADFLSQLDAYNSFKDDGANSTKRRKSTRVHIKDKNRYHDFDTPDGPMIPSHHHTPKVGIGMTRKNWTEHKVIFKFSQKYSYSKNIVNINIIY